MRIYVDELPYNYSCPFALSCEDNYDYEHCPEHLETREELLESGLTQCKMLKVLPRRPEGKRK